MPFLFALDTFSDVISYFSNSVCTGVMRTESELSLVEQVFSHKTLDILL